MSSTEACVLDHLYLANLTRLCIQMNEQDLQNCKDYSLLSTFLTQSIGLHNSSSAETEETRAKGEEQQMASQTASALGLDKVLFNSRGDVPRQGRALFGRQCHLRDVPRKALGKFAAVISMPVGENVTDPSRTWRREQAAGLKTLDSSLTMPLNPLARAFIHLGQRSVSLCPGASTLCDGHKGLDPRVVHHIEAMIINETNVKFSALRRYQYQAGVSDRVQRWLERIALVGGFWSSPERFLACYGFRFPDCREAHKLHLGSLAGGARNPCAACNLAAVGGRDRALIDLRAGCLARRPFHDGKAPHLIKLVDGWISCFGKDDKARMYRQSKRLGEAIAQAMRVVNDYEEATFAKSARPGVGVFAAAEDDTESVATPPRNNTINKSRQLDGSREDLLADSDQSQEQPLIDRRGPHMSSYDQSEADDGSEPDERAAEQMNNSWFEQQDWDTGMREAIYMSPFKSDYTYRSAVPRPLANTPFISELVVSRAPETAKRAVSPEFDLYNAIPRDSNVARNTNRATAYIVPMQNQADDDDGSWVSASVCTSANISRFASYRPLRTTEGVAARPTAMEIPITPAASKDRRRHSPSGLPTPPGSSGRRPSTPRRPGPYGGLPATPPTPSAPPPRAGSGNPYKNTYARASMSQPSPLSPPPPPPPPRLSRLARDDDSELRDMLEREELARNSPYFYPDPPPSSFYSQ